MVAQRKQTASSLVLSERPEHTELRELSKELEERRDRVAELDLEIETLRDELASFETAVRVRLANEHETLRRIDSLTRHIDQWIRLLEDKPAATVVEQAPRLDRRRDQELRAERERRDVIESERHDVGAQSSTPAERSERLKEAYRTLARRYHPDLAGNEEERVQLGQVMARINLLYRDADLERLTAMAQQATVTELDEATEVDDKLEHLRGRCEWLDAVLANLEDERRDLERSSTCQLWRNAQQAEAIGRDLVDEIRRELQQRIIGAYTDIPEAARQLEAQVQRYNRDKTAQPALSRRNHQSLEKTFDPFSDKQLVRLGLDALGSAAASPASQRMAEWLQNDATERPSLLRLILFAYVAELSPFPLGGLDSYEALQARFDALREPNDESLEEILVRADDLVEYGVRRASEKVAHTGLRFRNAALREAVPLAQHAFAVRRELKRVLEVIGEQEHCRRCRKDVFVVPLYRTRGLDDLRANVCPRCGEPIASYWMPRGKDVQAVLNSAYLDLDLVTEWSFRIARTSVSVQLLPNQVEELSVAKLKGRLLSDLFARYDIELARRHVRLWQDGRAVPERRALAELAERSFVVRFTDEAPMSEVEALEHLRHRIRNRFRSG